MISASRSSRHSSSITGRTTSSAASMISRTSMPVRMPSLSQTATSASTACCPRRRRTGACEPSICTAPARTASTELATPSPRFSWPWKPTCASSPSSATSAATRSADLLEDQRAGRVDDVHALAAGVGHDPRLLRQRLRRLASAPSSGSRRSPARARGRGRSAASEMSASVQCVAMRQIERAEVLRPSDVVLDADARQHQDGDLRVASRSSTAALISSCSAVCEKP